MRAKPRPVYAQRKLKSRHMTCTFFDVQPLCIIGYLLGDQRLQKIRRILPWIHRRACSYSGQKLYQEGRYPRVPRTWHGGHLPCRGGELPGIRRRRRQGQRLFLRLGRIDMFRSYVVPILSTSVTCSNLPNLPLIRTILCLVIQIVRMTTPNLVMSLVRAPSRCFLFVPRGGCGGSRRACTRFAELHPPRNANATNGGAVLRSTYRCRLMIAVMKINLEWGFVYYAFALAEGLLMRVCIVACLELLRSGAGTVSIFTDLFI